MRLGRETDLAASPVDAGDAPSLCQASCARMTQPAPTEEPAGSAPSLFARRVALANSGGPSEEGMHFDNRTDLAVGPAQAPAR